MNHNHTVVWVQIDENGVVPMPKKVQGCEACKEGK